MSDPEYLKPNKLSELKLEDFKYYWNRKNRLAIVEFDTKKCLVFFVEDSKKPQIPGYPATGVEYFDSHKLAVKSVKETYEKLNYTPEFAECGRWTT